MKANERHPRGRVSVVSGGRPVGLGGGKPAALAFAFVLAAEARTWLRRSRGVRKRRVWGKRVNRLAVVMEEADRPTEDVERRSCRPGPRGSARAGSDVDARGGETVELAVGERASHLR